MRFPVFRIASGTTAALVCALGMGLAARQQPPQQQPVFRAGSVFVSVDAFPRRDGRAIEGLGKDDFEVLEDGKRQTVETLRFVRVGPVTPDADRRDPTSAADANRQAADPANRLFVIFLDLFHVSFSGTHYAKTPILSFLSRGLAANDLFAVATPEVPVGQITFARRTETIESELTRHWDWGERDKPVAARNELEQRLAMCAPDDGLVRAHREELTSSALEHLVRWLGALREERKNIVLITEGWAPARGDVARASGARGRIPTIGVGRGGTLGVGANTSGMVDGAWCDAQAARLSQVDHGRRFRDLLDLARRANVSFYPIDVGGLGNRSRAVNTLLTLANNTDGKAVVNTNDLLGSVLKITDDLAAYYLLGYYSTNTAADGRFRRIDVRLKPSGDRVTARRGYLAPTERLLKAAADAASRPAAVVTPIDVALARLARIHPETRLYVAAAASPATFDIVVELASREVEGGRFKDGAPVIITIAPADDAATPITVDGRIEPGARSTLVRAPMPTVAQDALYRVRAVVSGGDDRLEADLDVRTGAPDVVGEPTMFRAGASPRAPLRPVADGQFLRSERLHVDWPVARSLEERAARLLSRRGEPLPVPVSLTERADGERVRLAADLSLTPLAAGDYVIELTAAHAGERVTRLVAFRVTR